ncbi:MAG: uracil phosphoribosyltransferase [Phycisphaerales bacterium]
MSQPDFPTLTVIAHPLIRVKISELRDARTDHARFRSLLNEVAGLMVYECTRDLPVHASRVRTPLEETEGAELATPVTLVPILRAGLGMTAGILALVPECKVGHIGLYRDEDTLTPVSYYEKLPVDVTNGPVFVVDPMLATGGSVIEAVARLKEQGCTDIRMICLVAAPEGVRAMADAHPDIRIYTAALDRELNELGYILPGLGDAGDRIFGTQ